MSDNSGSGEKGYEYPLDLVRQMGGGLHIDAVRARSIAQRWSLLDMLAVAKRSAKFSI